MLFRDHIEKCSAGNGIFFVLFDVSILIIRNNMILRRWGSIYLDKYEEEDFKIRRGKPLYLSETRFNILQKIWISSAFPRLTKHSLILNETNLARARVKAENVSDSRSFHLLGNECEITYNFF